jgi:antitoxin component YwqK of YwqJK toxin-antitoxin module
MKTLITILLFIGLFKSSFGICASDNRTLTEMLFQGKSGTIFTCKVLTFSTPKEVLTSSSPTYSEYSIVSNSDGSINGTATAEIVTVYFGKVDTNIVTLRAGSYLTVGMTYLIYTGGSGNNFSFGGNCDRWTKQITDNPATINELSILKQFSRIFKNKTSGKFIFTNHKNIVIARGRFKKGKTIKIWQHYYNNGTLKAEFDLNKNITSQYSANGFIKSKSTVNNKFGFYEQFSNKVNGQLTFTDKEVKNDTGMVMTVSEYYDNGNKKNLSSQININSNSNSSYSIGKTGEYKEYYKNGNIKLQGQYNTNKRIELWKWYHENGSFNTEFDYKDGESGQ